MAQAPLQCSKCNARLFEGVFNTPDLVPCPSCGAQLKVELFPAFFRPPPPARPAEFILTDSEASCFYHPQKKAQVPCEGCGRFLCALCDCELRGQHFCPSCLETGQTKGKIAHLANQRILYDSMALALVIVPMVTLVGAYVSFITAPIAIFLAIRHWRSPMGLMRRSRFRFIIAIALALLQLAGWIALVITLFYVNKRHG
jgi:ribosomal protein S27E